MPHPIMHAEIRSQDPEATPQVLRRPSYKLQAGVPADRYRAAVAVPRLIAEIGVGLKPPEVREHVREPQPALPSPAHSS